MIFKGFSLHSRDVSVLKWVIRVKFTRKYILYYVNKHDFIDLVCLHFSNIVALSHNNERPN